MRGRIAFWGACLFFLLMTMMLLHSQEVNAASGKTYALLISGASGDISSLMATDTSVAKMQDVISENKLETYPGQKKITVFKNYENANNTKANLNQYIDKAYAGAQKNDLAIFYYNGHSCQGTGLALNSKNVYSYSELATYLSSKIKCDKIIVIIDSCFSGNFIKNGLSQISRSNQQRFIAFLACHSDQYAQSVWGNSRFTKNLTAGLGYGTGKIYADMNQDGKVTVQELDSYIEIQMRQDLLSNRIDLTPDWEDQEPVTFAYNDTILNSAVYQYSKLLAEKSLKLNKVSLNLWKGQSFTLTAKKIILQEH